MQCILFVLNLLEAPIWRLLIPISDADGDTITTHNVTDDTEFTRNAVVIQFVYYACIYHDISNC